MTRTEADLRDAVSGHPANPDAEARLSAFSAALSTQPRRLRTWLVPIAAAVAVLIPVATVLAIRSGRQDTPAVSAIAPTTVTTDPSALFATPWELTDYFPATGPAQHQSSASGSTIVKFSQNSWTYSGDCNTGGGGRITVGPGTLTIGPTGYTSQAACPRSLQQELLRFEDVNATWQIRGNTLTITIPDGSRLVLSAIAGQPSSATPVSCDASNLSVAVKTLPATGQPTSIDVSLTNRSAKPCSLSDKYPVTILAGRLVGTPEAATGVLPPKGIFVQTFAITGGVCGNGAAVPGQDLKSWSVTAQGEIFRPPVSSPYVNFFVSCAEIVPKLSFITPQINPAPSETATITGRFTVTGGPAPGTQVSGVAGQISAYTNSAGTGTPVATTKSDSAGNFTLRLQPGAYYLYGTDPHAFEGSSTTPSRIAAANAVLAHQGGTTTADITFEVP